MNGFNKAPLFSLEAHRRAIVSVGDRRVLQSLIELMVSDVEKVRENGCLDVAGLVVFFIHASFNYLG